MQFFEKLGVYTKVEHERHMKVITTKWVDTNKGDEKEGAQLQSQTGWKRAGSQQETRPICRHTTIRSIVNADISGGEQTGSEEE